MGLHLGEGRLRAVRNPGEAEDYVGIDVNYAARIAAAGNGGQIVVSRRARRRPAASTGRRSPACADVELADDGLRSVKDFDEPLPLYRLVVPGVADDARPLRTTDAPTNLPGDVTVLVGRDGRAGAAGRRPRREPDRHPHGARAAAARRGWPWGWRVRCECAFPHGSWFVDLAAVRDPALIEPAIAVALNVRESTDRSVEDALRVYLRERTVLLVLDNLEQLLPPAPRRSRGSSATPRTFG